MRLLLIFFCVLTFSIPPAQGAGLADLTAAAEKGDPTAQTTLGERYATGRGVKKDYGTARRWYEKAAAQDHANGLRALGVLYEMGRGVKKNPAKAAQLYRRAADLGMARAQVNLGYLYEHGLGVKQDYGQALVWYDKAAAQGYPRGQVYLGMLYEQGKGVARDYGRALDLYRRAARSNYSRGQYRLAALYEKGLGVATNLDQARAWYKKAAGQGLPAARKALARLTRRLASEKKTALAPEKTASTPAADTGKAVPTPATPPDLVPDLPGIMDKKPVAEKSSERPSAETVPDKKPLAGTPPEPEPGTTAWYLWAAKQGNDDAQNTVGLMYLHGEELEQDFGQAVRWFKKAAKADNNAARNNLGLMYAQGQGVEQDYVQAARWFQLAAAAGNVPAQNNLGLMYTKGRGVARDPVTAAYWLEQAAQGGHGVAQNNLGVMYANGQGVVKNLQQALYWLEKSAAQGNDRARVNLEIVRNELKSARLPGQAGDPARAPLSPAAGPGQADEPAIGPEEETVHSAVEHFHFGNLYAREGKIDQAIGEYNQAVALDPDNANTYENLAIVYVKSGRTREAIKAMRIAIQLRPTDAAKYATLGIIHQANQEPDKALTQYIYAARLNPGLDWLFYNMAAIYLDRQDLGRAWKCATIAQALGYPDETIIKELKKLAPELKKVWQPDIDQAGLRRIVVKTRQQADRVRTRLAGGENFSQLADKVSIVPRPVNGGYIGPATEAPEFIANAIADLPLLELSPVISRENRYHLYQKIPLAKELLEIPGE
ncbi:MAG: tetratricopeptide repeat protein [Desulfobacterales bacterium]|nr:tetratricopeptide repeat protein [Desulfobacterales bacterium]